MRIRDPVRRQPTSVFRKVTWQTRAARWLCYGTLPTPPLQTPPGPLHMPAGRHRWPKNGPRTKDRGATLNLAALIDKFVVQRRRQILLATQTVEKSIKP